MAQILKQRRSSVEGKVPTTSDLSPGELAINTYDGRIFFEKNGGSAEITQILTANSQTTGSLELVGHMTASGNISCSSTSTGSFGTLNISGDAPFIARNSNDTTTGTITAAGFISTGNISGSALGTGSFGSVSIGGGLFTSQSLAAAGAGADNMGNHIASQDLNMNSFNIFAATHVTASGNISGSSTSTFSGGTSTFTNYVATHVTASGNISGSSTSTATFGNYGENISGSATSTGSFGRLIVDGGVDRVGIGTKTPLVNFDMPIGGGRARFGSGTVNVPSNVDVIANGGYTNAFGVWDDNSLSVPRFVVERSGKVGVGKDPQYGLLDVAGTIQALGISIYQTGSFHIDINGGSATEIVMENSDSDSFTLEVLGDVSASAASTGSFGSLVVTGTGQTIFNGGNVGIGTRTEAPEQKLHVMSGSIMVESSAYGQGRMIFMGRTGHQYEWYVDDPGLGQFSLYNRGRGGYDLTFAGGNATFTGTIGSGAITSTAGISGTTGTFTGNILSSGANAKISGSSTSTGSFGYLNVSGDTVIGGNLTFGDADTDTVVFDAEISSSFIPDTDNMYDLGSPAKRWQDLYAVSTTVGGVFEVGLRSEGVKDFQTGTVLVWSEDRCVSCIKNEDELVMGVSRKGKDEPIVLGAEPILVTGKVDVGDYIVTSKKIGHGKAVKRGLLIKKDLFGKVIAQSLEAGAGDSHTVKAMIRKM